MGYKLGIGLLLFGILISNGSSFSCGSIFFLVGAALGAIGLILVAGAHDREKSANEKNETETNDVNGVKVNINK